MIATVKSRQRIIDHGEVFTPPGLVNDMLDLVPHECERVDSRFLEPACGHGNFLTEVLRRRLATVERRYKPRTQWEPNALLSLACLYGIELLHDNVTDCRDRLRAIFGDAYAKRFGTKARPEVLAAARHIVGCNIVQGDAIEMAAVDDKQRPTGPLILTQWSLVGPRFKRLLYEYRQLSRPAPDTMPTIFEAPNEPIPSDTGNTYFEVRHVATLPLVHYLKLAETEGD